MISIPPFSVRTTSAFDRDFRKLAKQHRDLIEHYGRASFACASAASDCATTSPAAW